MNRGERLGSKDLLIISKKGQDNLRKGGEVNSIILNSSKLRHMNRRMKASKEFFRDFIPDIKLINMSMNLNTLSLIKVKFPNFMVKGYHISLRRARKRINFKSLDGPSKLSF